MRFNDRLPGAIDRMDSLLCVGLDPDPERLPASVKATPEGVLEFCLRIVEATREHCAAYKPNSAFFEAMGHEGIWVLEEVRKAIPDDHIALLDAKRGDIGNTAKAYATAIFDRMGFDAVTVNPYLGRESLLPFLERVDRGAFVLARTSNPSAGEVQNARTGEGPLYTTIVGMALEMGMGNVGFVVGATVPEALDAVRKVAPEAPLLIPGIGAQGGEIGPAVTASATGPVLINSSRGIIYASTGTDYAEAAGRAAAETAGRLRSCRDG